MAPRQSARRLSRPAQLEFRRRITDVVDTIRSFNAGRDPERLAMKYRKLRDSPFVFLRGTCHLFYDHLAKDQLLPKAPLAWSCGDLHLENFGSYKGDNRLVHFDVNDFDEAILAPATSDPVRFLTSVVVAADTLRASRAEALNLCRTFTLAYGEALADGKARWIERETAQGLVRELLETLKGRDRAAFLDRRTDRKKLRRVIRCDGQHALSATNAQREFATEVIDEHASNTPNPDFFKVLDVARRVAGTGSLGLERYVILIEGKGSPDGNYLLDLKQAAVSSLQAHLDVHQPEWPSEAHRVVALQRRLQAVSMAFLRPIVKRKSSFVLRGLQPSEDRVALDGRHVAIEQITSVLQDMGRLVAWSQLRSSGRQGAANADALIEFGSSCKNWQAELCELAHQCAAQVAKDWQVYSAAFDAGALAR